MSEKEKISPIWKHPYLIYILLTFVLFIFLLLMAWLARESSWIPSRGSLQPS